MPARLHAEHQLVLADVGVVNLRIDFDDDALDRQLVLLAESCLAIASLSWP
jgi:hypothetical protein